MKELQQSIINAKNKNDIQEIDKINKFSETKYFPFIHNIREKILE